MLNYKMNKLTTMTTLMLLFSTEAFLNAQDTPSTATLEETAELIDESVAAVEAYAANSTNLRVEGNLEISDVPADQTYSYGRSSIVMGKHARIPAGVANSIVISDDNYACSFADYGIAIGTGSRAGTAENPKPYNFAFGHYAKATGGNGAFALGPYAEATNANSIAVGPYAKSTNNSTVAFGLWSKSTGYMSLALGNYASSTGENSLALGNYTSALGIGTVAIGKTSSATAVDAYAIGNNVEANTFRMTALGTFNDYSAHAGAGWAWNESDALFVIGNGRNNENRSNALVMLKNGDTAISGNLSAKSVKLENLSGGIDMSGFERTENE